jgi:hypothetical protein
MGPKVALVDKTVIFSDKVATWLQQPTRGPSWNTPKPFCGIRSRLLSAP